MSELNILDAMRSADIIRYTDCYDAVRLTGLDGDLLHVGVAFLWMISKAIDAAVGDESITDATPPPAQELR